MTSRDPFFDVVKALAMLLVVIGHTRWAYGCQIGNPMIDNFIVGMNMPLFFMISGYFSSKTVVEGNWLKLGQHLVGYFWPVAVVSCAFAVLALVFGLEGSEKGLIGYAGRNFLFSPWYLWCLGICFALTFVACHVPRIPARYSIVTLLLILPFITHVWHVGNVRSMLPHFLFGMFILRRWEIWKIRSVGLVCLVVYVLVAVCLTSFRKNGLSFYNGATDWLCLRDIGNLGLYIARTVLGVCGSISVLWCIDKCVGNSGGGGANSGKIWYDNIGCVYLASMDLGSLRQPDSSREFVHCILNRCTPLVYWLPLSCCVIAVAQLVEESHLGPMVAEVRI